MIKVYDDERLGKEVVRISVKNEEDFEHNVGKTASFIIQCLAIEKKEVYIKFVSSTKKLPEISLKTQKMLIILNRMIKEGLEGKFGNLVPLEYRRKKMIILSSLPYVKDTEIYKVVKGENGDIERVKGEVEEGFTPKATIIKLYLAEEVS